VRVPPQISGGSYTYHVCAKSGHSSEPIGHSRTLNYLRPIPVIDRTSRVGRSDAPLVQTLRNDIIGVLEVTLVIERIDDLRVKLIDNPRGINSGKLTIE
jgi:hypothetical protein